MLNPGVVYHKGTRRNGRWPLGENALWLAKEPFRFENGCCWWHTRICRWIKERGSTRSKQAVSLRSMDGREGVCWCMDLRLGSAWSCPCAPSDESR